MQEIDWDDAVYRELMKPVAEQLRLLRATDDPSRRALIEDAICQQQRQATGVAKAPFVGAFVQARWWRRRAACCSWPTTTR